MSQLVRQVEAILFAASKRMSLEELKELIEESKDEDIQKALEELAQQYKSQDTSLTLISDDNSWKISLKDEYLPFAESLMPSTDLPKAVVETLAIIAWKNPIMQSDLVKLRSPVVYEHIAELEKLKLITRSKKGRTYVVKVTDKFYDYFDIPQSKAEEMFGQYEEPKAEDLDEESNVFNKGDSFDESADERDKRLIEEIKQNKIDPTAIIKEDREFLENFDERLKEIESQSNQANETLKEMDAVETEIEEGLEKNESDEAIIDELEAESEEIREENLDEKKEENNFEK